MNVDKKAFPNRLFHILEALSECHFVSLDFEFSGIASKPQVRNKQTLQQRYEETKHAAEQYQILQVGLTCVIQDRNNEIYTVKPYNIPLCPTFDEDLGIGREFSFQSGAVDFLLKNNFNFNYVFEDGVPYLSRDEEREAKRRFKAREDKSQFEDIILEDGDQASAAFIDKVRGEIERWISTKLPSWGEVSILSRTQTWDKCSNSQGDLTAYEKRLIHQLVRAEYPNLVTIGRRSAILVRYLDEEREARIRKDKYKWLKEKIYKQTGFRWIIEALTGGNLNNIDISWFAQDPETGNPRYYERLQFESKFHRAADRLLRHKPVLVGHNLFTDLVYLYSTFVGKLPDTVGEFKLRIHELFPMIVDTKYMFTHGCGEMIPASGLEQIDEQLQEQQVPRIEMHKEHTKYSDPQVVWLHEAGYDSLLTARAMILLSAKLEAEGTYNPDIDTSHVSIPTNERSNSFLTKLSINHSMEASPTTSCPALVTALAKDTSLNVQSSRKATSKEHKKARGGSKRSRFASPTLFEALRSTSINESSEDESADVKNISAVSSSFALDPIARPFPASTIKESAVDGYGTGTKDKSMSGGSLVTSNDLENTDTIKKKEKKFDPLMPPFETDFWRVYANKLRVFGTVEQLLDLNST